MNPLTARSESDEGSQGDSLSPLASSFNTLEGLKMSQNCSFSAALEAEEDPTPDLAVQPRSIGSLPVDNECCDHISSESFAAIDLEVGRCK